MSKKLTSYLHAGGYPYTIKFNPTDAFHFDLFDGQRHVFSGHVNETGRVTGIYDNVRDVREVDAIEPQLQRVAKILIKKESRRWESGRRR